MDNYLIKDHKIENFEDKNLVLVIYDVTDDKRRRRLHKFLSSYLIPVQRSCFETYLTQSELNEIRLKLTHYIDKYEDNVRIYELSAYGKVYNYGLDVENEVEEIVIIWDDMI